MSLLFSSWNHILNFRLIPGIICNQNSVLRNVFVTGLNTWPSNCFLKHILLKLLCLTGNFLQLQWLKYFFWSTVLSPDGWVVLNCSNDPRVKYITKNSLVSEFSSTHHNPIGVWTLLWIAGRPTLHKGIMQNLKN